MRLGLSAPGAATDPACRIAGQVADVPQTGGEMPEDRITRFLHLIEGASDDELAEVVH